MVQDRTPLEPARTVVNIVFALVSAVIIVTLVSIVFGSGSLFGIGHSEVCVDVRNGIVPASTAGNAVVSDVEEGVRSVLGTATLCDEQPTVFQRALRVLNDLPSVLVLLGSLVLAIRIFRAAGSEVVFTTRLATRTRALGWFVLVGGLIATLTESVSQIWLVDTMVIVSIQAMSWLGEWSIPMLEVFVGVVLISLGRIVQISVSMQEDLEGTV